MIVAVQAGSGKPIFDVTGCLWWLVVRNQPSMLHRILLHTPEVVHTSVPSKNTTKLNTTWWRHENCCVHFCSLWSPSDRALVEWGWGPFLQREDRPELEINPRIHERWLVSLIRYYCPLITCTYGSSTTVRRRNVARSWNTVGLALEAVIRTEHFLSIYPGFLLCEISKISNRQSIKRFECKALHKYPCLCWVIVQSQISLWIHKIL